MEVKYGWRKGAENEENIRKHLPFLGGIRSGGSAMRAAPRPINPGSAVNLVLGNGSCKPYGN